MLSHKLKSSLQEFIPAEGAMGGGARTINRKELRGRMDHLRKDVNKTYTVAVIMTVITFILLIFFIILYRDNLGVVTALCSVMGLTIASIISKVTQYAKDKANIDLIIVLSAEISGEQMFEIIKTLLEKNNKKSTTRGGGLGLTPKRG